MAFARGWRSVEMHLSGKRGVSIISSRDGLELEMLMDIIFEYLVLFLSCKSTFEPAAHPITCDENARIKGCQWN
jgi:hypothetical protein